MVAPARTAEDEFTLDAIERLIALEKLRGSRGA